MDLRIATEPEDILPFVDDAQNAADSARDELGFFPRAAYQEAAVSRKLWIACLTDRGRETYAGHIMFGGTFPVLKIRQAYVARAYPKRGITAKIVDALVEWAERNDFLTIKARVADDLEANGFWVTMGFDEVTRKKGGASRNRVSSWRTALETPWR